MALRDISNAVFLNGLLVSATWTPVVPALIVTGRSSSKNRYQVYPVLKDDIEGTGEFVELTRTITRERVGLTLNAAVVLQDAIEGVALNEAEGKSTTGGYREDQRIVGSYVHEYTVETRIQKMVSWTEGPPEEETAP